MTATTEIEVRTPQGRASGLPGKVHYARALAESGLLPGAYRKQPANILWAMEYGEMLGLTPMAAITGIHVIEGKPTASAGLISALVRRAGHKLRVSGDSKSATCQIVRADDTGYTFEVTFTIDDAKAAGLTGKDVWKKYAASMLKARAITQCARDACEEALFGLHYTPEELGAEVDGDGAVIGGDPFRPEPSANGAEDAANGARHQDRKAERSSGTPDGDQWYVRPAPEDDAGDGGAPAADTRPWAERALERAGKFQTEAEGSALWRETAARTIAGECTPRQKDHIQNRINARITARRKEAAARIMRPLADDDPWRLKVEELADDGSARATLSELGQLKAAGTLDRNRADLIGRAVIARFPKSALPGPIAGWDATEDPEDKPGSVTPEQLTRLHAALGEFGYDDREQKIGIAEVITGRALTGPREDTSTANLSYAEAERLIAQLGAFTDENGERARDLLNAWLAELGQDGTP